VKVSASCGAHESRAVIHRRLDEQVKRIGHLETTVAISGEIDAQIRNNITALTETVESNHKAATPALDYWRRVKVLGWAVAAVFLALGISAASAYAWAWDGRKARCGICCE
jgi:hypothetical protein